MKNLLLITLLSTICFACDSNTENNSSNTSKNTPKQETTTYHYNSSDSIYLRGAELNDLDPALGYTPNAHPPVTEGSKILWVSHSSLWDEAPDFQVETFLNGTEPMDMDKKLLVLNFWSSWCPPSRRSLPLMNHFQQKFKDDIIVINISDETPKVMNAFMNKYPAYDALFANDTMSRMKKSLGVQGVPHTVLIEPQKRVIVWEGFPLLNGFELTDTLIEKMINIVKKNQNK